MTTITIWCDSREVGDSSVRAGGLEPNWEDHPEKQLAMGGDCAYKGCDYGHVPNAAVPNGLLLRRRTGI